MTTHWSAIYLDDPRPTLPIPGRPTTQSSHSWYGPFPGLPIPMWPSSRTSHSLKCPFTGVYTPGNALSLRALYLDFPHTDDTVNGVPSPQNPNSREGPVPRRPAACNVQFLNLGNPRNAAYSDWPLRGGPIPYSPQFPSVDITEIRTSQVKLSLDCILPRMLIP